MKFSTLVLFSVSLTLLVLSMATLNLALDDVYFEHSCSTTKDNYTANSAYKTNINTIISQLSTLTKFNYGFQTLSAGRTPQDTVYLTALCRGDQKQTECNKCLNYTANELKQFCPWNKEATAWSQYCQVRYSDQTMLGQLINDPRTCVFNTKDAANPKLFNEALNDQLVKLSYAAAAGGSLRKYAADNTTVGNGGQQKIYVMVQCSPDMNQRNCITCLYYAIKELTNCCSGKLGCRVLRPTCFIRFEADWAFYGTPVPLPARPLPPIRSSPPRSFGRTK